MKRRAVSLFGCGVLGLAGLVAGPLAVSPAGAAHYEGHNVPPVILSVEVNAERQLVVKYTAPDGVLYGGYVYFGNDDQNATPVGSPSETGQFMFCNNNSSCQGRWPLNEKGTTAAGPFTFTSPPLDLATFPAGDWWVQVETTNKDPFPSTRYWLVSNIVKYPLAAAKPGAGGGGAGTAAKPRFKQVVVTASAPADGPPQLRVNVSCPNAQYYSVHTEFTTPSGKRFFGGAVAQGDLDSRGGASKVFRWKGGKLPKAFVLRVWNVACWAGDSANAVGPGRRVFDEQCSNVNARNPCEVRYKE